MNFLYYQSFAFCTTGVRLLRGKREREREYKFMKLSVAEDNISDDLSL